MQLHLKILGYIYAITGGIGLAMVLVMINPDEKSKLEEIAGLDTDPLLGYAAVILLILFIASTLSLIEGIGLLTRKPWARLLGLALGILSIIDIPIGTIIGVYTIVVLWKKETKQLLNK